MDTYIWIYGSIKTCIYIDMDTYISKELDIGNILTLTSNHIPSPKQSYDKSPMGH